jgi:hypothetical protein
MANAPITHLPGNLSRGFDPIDQISDIIANRFNKTTMTVKLPLTEILLNWLKIKNAKMATKKSSSIFAHSCKRQGDL